MNLFLKEYDQYKFPYSSWYLISIFSHDEGPYINPISLPMLKKLGMEDGISLNFWDITPDKHSNIKEHYPNAIFFDELHAQKIIKFIETIHKNKKCYPLIVHCSAGISRSGAVGTFACDYCGLDYNTFIKSNPYIMANPHVLSVLRNEAKISIVSSHDGISNEKIITTWNYQKDK